jgi:hypothetical protein
LAHFIAEKVEYILIRACISSDQLEFLDEKNCGPAVKLAIGPRLGHRAREASFSSEE